MLTWPEAIINKIKCAVFVRPSEGRTWFVALRVEQSMPFRFYLGLKVYSRKEIAIFNISIYLPPVAVDMTSKTFSVSCSCTTTVDPMHTPT